MTGLQEHDLGHLASSGYLVGVDEAGRGCLAGPVVAGACVVKRDFFESAEVLARTAGINDSKQLGAPEREALFAVMEDLKAEGWLDFAVAEGSVELIAERNILGATREAMAAALEALAGRSTEWRLPLAAAEGPLFEGTEGAGVRILVDGRPLKPFAFAHRALVKGDGRSLVIAMASIAAKVNRDRTMEALEAEFPGYGFAQHKGYGTAAHRAALRELGACEAHRALFLRKVLGGSLD
jgi:ribonuclease HII